MRRFNRWFTVLFLFWWSAILGWDATNSLRDPTVAWFPVTPVSSILIGLNLLGVSLVSRGRFRRHAVEFVAE